MIDAVMIIQKLNYHRCLQIDPKEDLIRTKSEEHLLPNTPNKDDKDFADVLLKCYSVYKHGLWS